MHCISGMRTRWGKDGQQSKQQCQWGLNFYGQQSKQQCQWGLNFFDNWILELYARTATTHTHTARTHARTRALT